MEILKKYFPHAFKAEDVASLIVTILIYLIVALVGGLVVGLVSTLLSWIPIVGVIFNVLCKFAGSVVSLYAVAGIVIAVLAYGKVLK